MITTKPNAAPENNNQPEVIGRPSLSRLMSLVGSAQVYPRRQESNASEASPSPTLDSRTLSAAQPRQPSPANASPFGSQRGAAGLASNSPAPALPLTAMTREDQLINALTNLVGEQARDIVNNTRVDMFNNTKATANTQGANAYAYSFGAVGIASRAASQIVQNTTTNPITRFVTNVVMPLAMPLVHASAGGAATPGRDGTVFVQQGTTLGREKGKAPPSELQPLAPNAAGNAFAPFIGGLAYGNAGVAAMVEVPTAAVNAFRPDTPAAFTSTSMERNTITAIKSLLTYLPGMKSGEATAQNIYNAQLNAGWSLREPIKASDGSTVGTFATHQTASARPEHVIHDVQLNEVAGYTIDVVDKQYKVSILQNPDNKQISFQLAGHSEVPTDPSPLSATKQAASKYLSTLGQPSWQTAVKVTSLASTLLAIAIIAPVVQNVTRSVLIENGGISPEVAEPLSQMAGAFTASMLLGHDFIPKFMSFGHSSPKFPVNDVLKELGQLAGAAVPVMGGKIEQWSRNVDPTAASPIQQDGFDVLGLNKLEVFTDMIPRGLVTQSEDRLIINAAALIHFTQGLATSQPTDDSNA